MTYRENPIPPFEQPVTKTTFGPDAVEAIEFRQGELEGDQEEEEE